MVFTLVSISSRRATNKCVGVYTLEKYNCTCVGVSYVFSLCTKNTLGNNTWVVIQLKEVVVYIACQRKRTLPFLFNATSCIARYSRAIDNCLPSLRGYGTFAGKWLVRVIP